VLIGLAAVVSLFTILWLASLAVNNASIVDMWWGPGIFLPAARIARLQNLRYRRHLGRNTIPVYACRTGRVG